MAITKVTNSLVATNAIQGTLIADNAITSVHIAQNQVTSVQIPDSSITSTQLAANSVDTAELISGSIDAIHLASDSVTTAKILNANVTTAKIANNAITSALIPDGSITDTQLGSGAFTMGNITTTGSIRGPASFTIDPAAVGDNTGTVVIAGNLQVDGTQTIINSTSMSVDDLNLTLASGAADAAAANGAGLTIDGASATLLYASSGDKFVFNKTVDATIGTAAQPNITSLGTLTNLTVSNTLYIGSGSGTTTSYISDYEDDLYIYNKESAGKLFLGTDNDTKVTIDSSGKVGIGTSTPAQILDVKGRMQLTRPVASGHASEGNWDFNISHEDAARYGSLYITPSVSTAEISLMSNKFRFTNTGRLGIGTATPAQLFEVRGNAGKSRFTRSGSTGTTMEFYAGASPAGGIQVQSTGLGISGGTGENHVFIDTSGKVGVGTSSPSTKLTVRNDSANTSFGDNSIITLQNANTTDNSRMGLAFTGNTGIGSGLAVIDAVSYDQSHGKTSLNFSVYSGSWHNDMMVLKAGNVGIGTSTPNQLLQVKESSTSVGVYYPLSVGGSSHIAGYAAGIGLDPEGYGNRNKIAIVAEGRNNGYSRGKLHFLLDKVDDSNEATLADSKMVITEDGEVGIGTNAPSAAVPLTAYYSNTSQFHFGGAQAGISNNVYYNGSAYTNRNTSAGGALLQLSTDGSFAMRRATSGSSPTLTYSMYIDGSGNVGIGESSPAKLGLTGSTAGKVLHMGGDDCQLRLANSILHHDNSGNTILHLRNNYGATSDLARTKIESGYISFCTGTAFDEKMRLKGSTLYVSTDIGAHSGGSVNGNSYAHNTYAHAAVFGANSVPDGTVVIEDYDVSSGIGNTVLKLYLRDQDPATSATFIDFADGGGRVGSITHNDDGGGVSFNETSDYRLKENVNYNWDATTLLKQLKPAKFNFKRAPGKIKQGFLAHEVSDLVPSSVRGDKDQMMEIGTIKDKEGNEIYEGVYEHFCKEGQTWTKTGTKAEYQQLDYSKLVPLLTKALQELEARIATLEG